MRCIIVDDDPFSAKIMSDFINRTSSLTLLQTFSSAIDAIDYLGQTSGMVQVIFLDIEMPEMNGLEFIKSIDRSMTQIILCSSQEKYALQSYEYDVCDYLLKPVNYARFLKAINKAKSEFDKLLSMDGTSAVTATSLTMNGTRVSTSVVGDDEEDDDDTRIFIKDVSGGMFKLWFKDLIYVEAQENYIQLVTTETSKTIHMTMKKIVESIPEKYLMRVHRSYAVGVKYLLNIKDGEIELDGADKMIPVGRSYRDVLRPLVDKLCQK